MPAALNEKTREQSVWNRVNKTPECWLWIGYKTPLGYGRYSSAQQWWGTGVAHQIVWYLVHGTMPTGELDHLCRNPSCVRPSHLEDVDHRTNVLRGIGPTAINATKTHCPRGHAFSEQNTKIQVNGARMCRTCYRILDRERDAKGRRRKDNLPITTGR